MENSKENIHFHIRANMIKGLRKLPEKALWTKMQGKCAGRADALFSLFNLCAIINVGEIALASLDISVT